MSEEEKQSRGVSSDHSQQQQQQPQYGTFQGVANYPPPLPPRQQQPVIGFPQPAPPPGSFEPQYYAQGYQTVPGYTVAEGRPVRERRLPCCGIGIGWCLFIIGFFLGSIPWYIGLFILLCGRIDPREKPGYVACVIAVLLILKGLLFFFFGHIYSKDRTVIVIAILVTVAIILGVTKGTHEW